MGAQSFIMMFQAGEGWQYGKRRISAMSNEDFNKLTPLRLLQNQAANLRSSISTIEKSMNDMTPMIRTIILQYGDFLKEIISVTPAVAKDVSASLVKETVKQTTGQSITLAQASAIVSGLLGPLANLGQFGQEAAAQVPSGGPLTTSIEQFDKKTAKLVLPPKGTNVRGFLGGPAPKISVAQQFREFEKTRNISQKLLNSMIKTKNDLISRIRSLQNSERAALAQRNGNAPTIRRAYQILQGHLAKQEKLIVFQKIKVNRR